VGAENLVHVMRPGGIRWSCRRRGGVFVPDAAQDRPVRVAVSAGQRSPATGEALTRRAGRLVPRSGGNRKPVGCQKSAWAV